MTLRFFASLLSASLVAASFGQVAVNRVRTIEQFHVTATTAAYSGSLIAFATEDNTVRIYDTAAGQTRFQLVGHPQNVQALAFNRAGTLLATTDVTARMYLWDVKTGKKVREFPRDKGHTKGIIGVAFNFDGSKIATVGNDDAIKVWKTSGGNPIGTILGKGANLYGVAFSASGALLTSALSDGVRVYNGTTLQLAATIPVPGGQGVNGIAANRDGSMALSAGRDGKMMMWSIPGRSKVQTYVAHHDWVINTAVSPNGKYGASSSVDQSVIVWNLATGKPAATIPDTSVVGSPIAFTGDGKYFVATSASDGLTIYSVTPAQGGGGTTAAKGGKKKRK